MILYTMDQYLVGFLVFAEIQKKKKKWKEKPKRNWKHESENFCNNK